MTLNKFKNKLLSYVVFMLIALMPYKTGQEPQCLSTDKLTTQIYSTPETYKSNPSEWGQAIKGGTMKQVQTEIDFSAIQTSRATPAVGKLLSDSSITRIFNIANKYDIKPSWIIMAALKESNLNPKAVNPYSGATGVIQFLPSTARYLGTSVSELYNMSIYQQLYYVDKYIGKVIKSRSHHVKSYADFHLGIFYPKALGKPNNYVIGYKNSMIVKQNKLMANKEGYITVKDFKKYALKI